MLLAPTPKLFDDSVMHEMHQHMHTSRHEQPPDLVQLYIGQKGEQMTGVQHQCGMTSAWWHTWLHCSRLSSAHSSKTSYSQNVIPWGFIKPCTVSDVFVVALVLLCQCPNCNLQSPSISIAASEACLSMVSFQRLV